MKRDGEMSRNLKEEEIDRHRTEGRQVNFISGTKREVILWSPYLRGKKT